VREHRGATQRALDPDAERTVARPCPDLVPTHAALCPDPVRIWSRPGPRRGGP